MKVKRLFATWFGSGYCPVASGTAGSLAAVPLLFFMNAGGFIFRLIVTLVITGVGIICADAVEKEENTKDPGIIVIDEVSGMCAAALLYPGKLLFVSIMQIFFLFRIFDIWKPGPVKRAESLPGGYGIMFDDVIAGLFAGILLSVYVLIRRK